jgi:hypothetical protein
MGACTLGPQYDPAGPIGGLSKEPEPSALFPSIAIIQQLIQHTNISRDLAVPSGLLVMLYAYIVNTPAIAPWATWPKGEAARNDRRPMAHPHY